MLVMLLLFVCATNTPFAMEPDPVLRAGNSKAGVRTVGHDDHKEKEKQETAPQVESYGYDGKTQETSKHDKIQRLGAIGAVFRSTRAGMRQLLATLPTMSGGGQVLVSHLQIVALLPTLIAIDWPPELLQMAATLRNLVCFDPDLLALDCVHPSTYYDRLFGPLLTLISLFAAIGLLCGGVLLVARLRRSRDMPQDHRLRRFKARCTAFYLIVGFVFYSPVSSIVLKYFNCVEFGDSTYLINDVSIKCTEADGLMGDRYKAWLPLAVFGVLFVVIGIPVANLTVLWWLWRRGRLSTPYCKHAYGPLYAKYNDANCFWEMVEVTKRLVFTSALVLLQYNVTLQCVVGLVLVFAIITAHSNRRPYKHAPDDRISLAAHIGIFMILLTGLQVQAGHTPQGSELSLFLVLAMLPFLVFATMLLLVVFQFTLDKVWKRVWTRRQKRELQKQKTAAMGQRSPPS